MKNPCEKHLNVRASDGYCPICLLDENAQLRTQLDEARKEAERHYMGAQCPCNVCTKLRASHPKDGEK